MAVLDYTEALRQAQIISAADFDFTPYVALALVYIVITIPEARFVDRLVARDQRRRQAVEGCEVARAAALRIEDLHKPFEGLEVLKGIDLEVEEHEVVGLIGASGSASRPCSGASTCSNPSHAGRVFHRGRGDHRPRGST